MDRRSPRPMLAAASSSQAFSSCVNRPLSRFSWPRPQVESPTVKTSRTSERKPVASLYCLKRGERAGRPPVASWMSATRCPLRAMSAYFR